MSGTFESRADGLWFVEPKEGKPTDETWLCSQIKVLGQTRDAASNSWGLYTEWLDQDGIKHSWPIPRAVLVGRDSSLWLSRLADEGLQIAPSPRAKQLLALYLSTVKARERVLCVGTTGWNNGAFVLPDSTYTPFPTGQAGNAGQLNNINELSCPDSKSQNWTDWTNDRIVLQAQSPNNPYQVGGTLDSWKKTIGSWAVSNSRLALAICASLAAVLLEPMGAESGGFNLPGGTSSGKTTTLKAGSSVWGKGSGTGGYIQSWRATDNGLEGISALHNDTCLCLDELGQAPPKVASEAIYMLANGRGKNRARQDGTARQAKTWRTMILSTGEKTIAEKIAADGGRIQAGQEIRLVDIPADAGAGHGVFEELHEHKSPREFAEAISAAANTHYGHLGRAFIQEFLRRPESKAEIESILQHQLKVFCPEPKTDGQVLRVAKRFLLAAAAGVMAARWKLLPWAQDEALESAKVCFDAWLEHRGGSGAHEDAAALAQVSLFIEQNGQSRFQDVKDSDALCINRVGFREQDGPQTVYYILPESFKSEVCRGISHTRAAKLLLTRGILQPGDSGSLTRRPPHDLPTFGRKRCYTLIFGGNGQETD